MNITESNATMVLIRALHGDRTQDPDTVLEAADLLYNRAYDTLDAGPQFDDGTVLASIVSLQVQLGDDEPVEATQQEADDDLQPTG